jgi:hypothetical protein
MAINGWCNNQSTAWKKVQDQIQQTEVNQVQNGVLVDDQGIPLGITVNSANRHDMKMTKATLQNIVICRPQLSSASSTTTTKNTQQQHICLDKGYDYPEVYELLEEYSYTMHICKRGEKYNNGNKKKKKKDTKI